METPKDGSLQSANQAPTAEMVIIVAGEPPSAENRPLSQQTPGASTAMINSQLVQQEAKQLTDNLSPGNTPVLSVVEPEVKQSSNQPIRVGYRPLPAQNDSNENGFNGGQLSIVGLGMYLFLKRLTEDDYLAAITAAFAVLLVFGLMQFNKNDDEKYPNHSLGRKG